MGIPSFPNQDIRPQGRRSRITGRIVWEQPVRDVVFATPVVTRNVGPDIERQNEWTVGPLKGRWKCGSCKRWATKRNSPCMATRNEVNFCQRCVESSGMKSVWAKMQELLEAQNGE